MHCNYDVDPKGGPLYVAPYVESGVDADLSGIARGHGEVKGLSVVAEFKK